MARGAGLWFCRLGMGGGSEGGCGYVVGRRATSCGVRFDPHARATAAVSSMHWRRKEEKARIEDLRGWCSAYRECVTRSSRGAVCEFCLCGVLGGWVGG